MPDRRPNQTLAFVLPFAVFMLFLPLLDAVKKDNPLLPWWQSAPEHWGYPLQTVLCLGVIFYFWRSYPMRPARGLLFGALIGVAGIALWILPAELYGPLGVESWAQPGFAKTLHDLPVVGGAEDEAPNIYRYFGLARRLEGFDPTIFTDQPAAYWLTVVLRFLRMVVAVALVEEIFWRGFLMRYLTDLDRPFFKTPFGQWNPRAFFLTAFFFMLVHNPEDWLVAFLYGLSINFVAVRTKSLAACVLCHAVSNLILGIYVMVTKQWGFW